MPTHGGRERKRHTAQTQRSAAVENSLAVNADSNWIRPRPPGTEFECYLINRGRPSEFVIDPGRAKPAIIRPTRGFVVVKAQRRGRDICTRGCARDAQRRSEFGRGLATG